MCVLGDSTIQLQEGNYGPKNEEVIFISESPFVSAPNKTGTMAKLWFDSIFVFS
jgi:hypothetical protein